MTRGLQQRVLFCKELLTIGQTGEGTECGNIWRGNQQRCQCALPPKRSYKRTVLWAGVDMEKSAALGRCLTPRGKGDVTPETSRWRREWSSGPHPDVASGEGGGAIKEDREEKGAAGD